MHSFRGEWWKPADPFTSGLADATANADLELGLHKTAPSGIECHGLSYYERLGRDEFVQKRKTSAREVKIHVLTHLRHLALCSVNDKLLFLENKLTGCGHLNEEELENLIVLLRRQADLVRDFEFLTRFDEPSFEHLLENDSNISARNRFPEYDSLPHLGDKPKSVLRVTPTPAKTLIMYLNRFLPPWFTSTASERAKRKQSYTKDRPPIAPSIAVRALAAAITTLAGGSFIIAPMVFMSFAPSLEKSLATVSVSVLVFGFILDTFIARTSSETFIATATYAAVLVVFVASSGVVSG